MANQKIQLKSVNGNKLFPRTSINNIVGEDYTTVVSIPVLDGTGKIKPENLPSYVDDVIELIATRSPLLSRDDKGLMREQRQLILNALDLLYFWMYQPRARLALRQLLTAYTPDERRILLGTQRILEREREITQMFLDQLVGKRFSPALACYLEKWRVYLRDLEAMVRAMDRDEERAPAAVQSGLTPPPATT